MVQCKVCKKQYRLHPDDLWWKYNYCYKKCRDKVWKARIDNIINLLEKCPIDIALELADTISCEHEEILEKAGVEFLEKNKLTRIIE